jgi:hypothetical protein
VDVERERRRRRRRRGEERKRRRRKRKRRRRKRRRRKRRRRKRRRRRRGKHTEFGEMQKLEREKTREKKSEEKKQKPWTNKEKKKKRRRRRKEQHTSMEERKKKNEGSVQTITENSSMLGSELDVLKIGFALILVLLNDLWKPVQEEERVQEWKLERDCFERERDCLRSYWKEERKFFERREREREREREQATVESLFAERTTSHSEHHLRLVHVTSHGFWLQYSGLHIVVANGWEAQLEA